MNATTEATFRVSHATVGEDAWAVMVSSVTLDGGPVRNAFEAHAGDEGWVKVWDGNTCGDRLETKTIRGTVVIEVPDSMRAMVPTDRVLP